MLDFGGGPTGGAMVTGRWINRNTGDVINVRDSFIDDSNNMFLMTDRGQLSMDEFTKYYIQASDEVYDMSGKVVDTKPVESNELSFAVDNKELQADPIYLGGGMDGKIDVPKPIKNFELIDKIFKKTDSKPEVNLKINWADFPEKELLMLVNYFDVKKEEIASYIGEYLINSELLNESLTLWLEQNLAV